MSHESALSWSSPKEKKIEHLKNLAAKPTPDSILVICEYLNEYQPFIEAAETLAEISNKNFISPLSEAIIQASEGKPEPLVFASKLKQIIEKLPAEKLVPDKNLVERSLKIIWHPEVGNTETTVDREGYQNAHATSSYEAPASAFIHEEYVMESAAWVEVVQENS